MVNFAGSSPFLTWLQASGIETVAPSRARGESGATAVDFVSLRRLRPSSNASTIAPWEIGACLALIAFGSDKDGSWAVAVITAVSVVTLCVTLPSRSRTLN